MFRGKNYKTSVALYDKSKLYDSAEAMSIICQTSKAKFDETYKVFFRGCGDRDQFLGTFPEDDGIVKEKGVREDRHLYHGGHVWGVWRECLRDYASQLFR